jgi:hypothetical protein
MQHHFHTYAWNGWHMSNDTLHNSSMLKEVIRHNAEVYCFGHRHYSVKFPYTVLYGYNTIQT